MQTPSGDKIVEASVALAEAWQNRANELLTVEEKGIALQAYLPDSYDMQKELTAWAAARVAKGGSPIKIRIVKAANMEMEQLESAMHNWPLAPYDNKLEVDANFKRMVDFGMVPEHLKAVHLGIASHNLFELAYAYKLAQQHDVSAYISFEMLKGMADHVRRAIQEMSGDGSAISLMSSITSNASGLSWKEKGEAVISA